MGALAFSIFCFVLIPTGHHNPIKLFMEVAQNHKINTLAYAGMSNLTIFGSELSRLSCLDTQYSIKLLSGCAANSTGAHNLLFIPQAWTLAIEIFFYLIAPFVCLKLSRSIGLLAIIQFSQIIFGDHFGIINNESFTPIQLKYFLIGAIANLLISRFEGKLYYKNASSVIILLAIFTVANWSENYILLAMLTSMFLMIRINQKEGKFSRYIGQFSYPLYLVHYPLAKYFEDHLEYKYQFIVTATASFLFSYILIIGIVNPTEKMRSKVKHEIQS